IANPALQKTNQPFLAEFVEEGPDIGVQYPAHLLAVDPNTERIHRIMRAAPRPEPVREPEEIFLVDRVQHCGHCPLDDLVLYGGARNRALPSICLRDVDPPARHCPICSPMDPVVQISEVSVKVCLVVLPSQSIHSGCCVLL